MTQDFAFPSDAILINETKYVEYTSEWRKNISQQSPFPPLNSYFVLNGDPIFSVVFSGKAISALLSTIGITTVKMKFCIVQAPNFNQNSFNIVFFGTSTDGIVKSAYYLGSPCTKDFIGGGNGGNVPDKLAEEWINNWRNNYAIVPSPVSRDLFGTTDGDLKGYTYDFNDIKNAFYSDKNDIDEYLCFHFSVHKHYMPGVDNANNKTDTFDTVLQGVNKFFMLTTNLFYDISSPCPPTC